MSRLAEIAVPVSCALNHLVGKYMLNFQVSGIGDYIVDVGIKDHKLIVTDPNNGEIHILNALEK